jgi:hypothetical protein
MRLIVNAARLVAVLLGAALAPSACTSSNNSGSATSNYCSALASYAKQCKLNDACTQAHIQSCTTSAATFSDAYLTAVAQCASENACGDAGGSVAASSCIATKTASITPTAAQTKLGNDYCRACPASGQSSAQCSATFFAPATGATPAGIGVLLLEFSDALVEQIDSTCIGIDATLGCEAGFFVCELGVIGQSAPTPAACVAGATLDGG